MKKVLILGLVVAAAVFLWNRNQHGGGPLDDLRQRLDAAEQSFQQAGRAAGMSGADTTAGAENAAQEVEQVERALRKLEHEATSEAEKQEIASLLARASDLKRRMG
jgi:HAMP domain-containing protein